MEITTSAPALDPRDEERDEEDAWSAEDEEYDG